MVIDDMQAEQFRAHTNVSRETFDLYKLLINHLTRWNKKINLVSANTIDNYWLRHALDSYQLTKHIPATARRCIDLGSGAGFPGLTFAIAMRERANASVTLVESNGKKCNFLRMIIREFKLPARVLQERAETVAPEVYDVISARAFAPLPKLLEYSERFWGKESLGVFPKGANWKTEIDQAKVKWDFEVETEQSETDSEARILLVRNLSRKSGNDQSGELS